ncbi:MAG TPA: hypothetical protein VE287_04390, partial [Actinopolymorphaceae bacterium]|nr:hypothetical protein [Actinopolymorphaceae bacterium]
MAALTALTRDPAAPVGLDPSLWFKAYKRAGRAVAAMPVALNHNELAFQQVGRPSPGSRADGDRPLVVFDLETMALLPRFADIADMLGVLSEQTGRGQRELFATYLTALRHQTGVALDESSAWNELLTLRITRTFESLPWLTEIAGHPDVRSTPATAARALEADPCSVGLAG